WATRAERLAARGQWESARADLARALRVQGAPTYLRLDHTLLGLQCGDREGSRKGLAALLDQAERTGDAAWIRTVATAALIVPDTVTDPVRLAEVLGKGVTDEKSKPQVLRLQGMALYRAGKYAEAEQTLKAGMQLQERLQPGAGVDVF